MSLEHVPGSTERQVKCSLAPWPPVLLSICLGIHSPMTPGSVAVLERTLCVAHEPRAWRCPRALGLDAISELSGSSWAARSASCETCQARVLWAGRTLGLKTLFLVTLWGNWIYQGSEDLTYVSHFVSSEYTLPYVYFHWNLRQTEE